RVAGDWPGGVGGDVAGHREEEAAEVLRGEGGFLPEGLLQLLGQGLGLVESLPPLEEEGLVEHGRSGLLVEGEELLGRHAARQARRDDRAGAGTGDVVEKLAEPEGGPLAG